MARMRRIVFAVATALALSSAPTMAAPPEPFDVTFTLNPGEACSFSVELAVTGKVKMIELPGNRTIFTAPGQNATVTNLDNGHSVTLNITGAFHQSVEANGDAVTVATGRNLLLDPIAGFVLSRGRFTFAFDAAGNLIAPLSGTGRTTDVCALIA
jgi:hypothetical protein